MLAFVTAVAEADSNIVGRFNNFARFLVVEHMQCMLVAEYPLLNKDPAELGLTGQKKIPDKIFLSSDVLLIDFTQKLLVNIAASAHQGKLKETSHRWRQHVFGLAIESHIDQ